MVLTINFLDIIIYYWFIYMVFIFFIGFIIGFIIWFNLVLWFIIGFFWFYCFFMVYYGHRFVIYWEPVEPSGEPVEPFREPVEPFREPGLRSAYREGQQADISGTRGSFPGTVSGEPFRLCHWLKSMSPIIVLHFIFNSYHIIISSLIHVYNNFI